MTRAWMRTTIVAVGVAGALAAGAVAAQQPDGQNAPQARMRRPGPGGPAGPLFERHPGVMLPLAQLDLTEAQREQVRGVLQSHREEMQATHEKLRAAAKAKDDAVKAVPFDEGTIRQRAAELAEIDSDAAVLHARLHSEVFALLTPEQQAKARAIEAEREKRMAEMRQRTRQRIK